MCRAALLVVGLVAASIVPAEPRIEAQPPATGVMGRIVSHDARFDALVPAGTVIEKLADGFLWSEGPVWVKAGGYLLFTDIPRNAVNKWQPGRGITTYLKPAGFTAKTGRGGEQGANGLLIDPHGHLLLCQHGDRRVARLETDGSMTTLADRYEGKRFNSPNDLTYAANGDLYFTDPPYGLEKGWDDAARELDFCGVYRLTAAGKITLLTRELSRPNGLGFSPDGQTLYVANSDPKKALWMAYPVKADGTLAAGKVFFDATAWVTQGKKGLPDGLKVDRAGFIWATGPGGVHVFSPNGDLLGTLETGVATANCAFGEDGSTLYITAHQNLCRVRTKARGF